MSLIKSQFGWRLCCLTIAVIFGAVFSENSSFVAPALAGTKMQASATVTARDENTAINLATRKALDKFRKLYPAYRGELLTSMGGASTKGGKIQVTVTVSAQ